MSYCSTGELKNLTGSLLSDTILQEIIDQSDRYINGRLLMMNIGVPTSDDTLKAASLNISIVAVLSHPDSDQVASSVKLGDITIKRADLVDVMTDMSTQAWQNVHDYIMRHGVDDTSRYYIRKVN